LWTQNGDEEKHSISCNDIEAFVIDDCLALTTAPFWKVSQGLDNIPQVPGCFEQSVVSPNEEMRLTSE
jgi:hypothetical protein